MVKKKMTVKMMVFGLILAVGALLAFDLMPETATQGRLKLSVGSEHFRISRESTPMTGGYTATDTDYGQDKKTADSNNGLK